MSAESRLATIDGQIAEYEEALEALRQKRKDFETPPEPVESTLSVGLTWDNTNGKTYTYVLTRVYDSWYVTGGSIRKTFTWPELVNWMRAADSHTPVRSLVPGRVVLPFYSKS